MLGARWALKVSHGLRAEYFETITSSASPALAVVDDEVSLAQMMRRWDGDPPDAFHVRWFGYLTSRDRTSCTFALTSDDGSTLTIDGHLVIDNSGRHGPVTKTAQVDLLPAAHPVLIEYEQLGGGLELAWTWACDGGQPSPVPARMLTPDRAASWKLTAASIIDIGSTVLFAGIVAFGTFAALRHGARPAWHWGRAHPAALALGFFVVLTLLETWPLVTDVAHLSRTDNADAVLLDWVLAWVAHQAPRAPLHLFDTNAFYPDRNTLAFSEAMIVQSALAAPIIWAGGSPVLAFNLVTLAGFALSGWAMYLVIARWTGSRIAGLAAGVIYAFNAHSFTRLPHLQAQHTEFLPLALFALDRLLREPAVRNALVLALWFSLEALTSIYLLVLTAVALTISFAVRPDAWRGPRVRQNRADGDARGRCERARPRAVHHAVLAAVSHAGARAIARRGADVLGRVARLPVDARALSLPLVELPVVLGLGILSRRRRTLPDRGRHREAHSVRRSARTDVPRCRRGRHRPVVRSESAGVPDAVRARSAAPLGARSQPIRVPGDLRGRGPGRIRRSGAAETLHQQSVEVLRPGARCRRGARALSGAARADPVRGHSADLRQPAGTERRSGRRTSLLRRCRELPAGVLHAQLDAPLATHPERLLGTPHAALPAATGRAPGGFSGPDGPRHPGGSRGHARLRACGRTVAGSSGQRRTYPTELELVVRQRNILLFRVSLRAR